LRVSSTTIERRQVVLEIEVEPERVQKALDRAYQRAASRVKIPGFRPGKAPRPLVERVVGSDALLEDALERLVPEVYDEAVKSEGIKASARPQLEIVSTTPLQVKATVPLEPSVTLGDHRAIRRERPSAEPTDDEIEAVLQQLRESHAEWAPVERAVQLGDRVNLDVALAADNRTLLDSKEAETIVDPERPQPAPGFAEALVGIAPGETRQFTLHLPDDYEDQAIAGEDVQVTVTVHGVKERRLPPLDDELARLVGEEYADVEALRAAVRGQVAESKASRVAREFEERVLEDVIAQSTVELPPQLVERQAEAALQSFARSLDRQGLSVEQYMKFTNRTPESFRAELLADAEGALKRSLVVDAIADAEGVVISDEDVEAEIRRVGTDAAQAGAVDAALASAETRERIRTALRQREAVRRLLESAAQRDGSDVFTGDEQSATGSTEVAEQPEAVAEE